MRSRPRHEANAQKRLHGLDTLRAVAILSVMPFHLQDHFPSVLQPACRFGWMGVDLFFVLSGYLIASQLLREHQRKGNISLRRFYTRRAYRIFPAFLAVLLLYQFLPAWREAPGMQPAWQFATFTENLLIDYERNRAFSHAWSLCVEEHFYLFMPLLAIFLLYRPAAWKTSALLLTVLFTGLAARSFVVWHFLKPLGTDSDSFGLFYIEKLYYPTYTRLDGLLAGVALAVMQTHRTRWWSALTRHGHLMAATGMALVGLEGWCWLAHSESLTGRGLVNDLFGFLLLGLGFALLTASALSLDGWLARIRVPGASLLATLAFSLYLTHKEAVHLLFVLFPGLAEAGWTTMVWASLACLAVAGMLHLLVERPFLWLREHRAGRPAREADLSLQARTDPAI